MLNEKMTANKDGFSFSVNTGAACRTLDKKQFTDALDTLPLTWQRLVVHFRFATVGTVSKNNVHLWEIDGVRFGHNGHVYGYGTATDSDSLDFFRKFRVLFGKTPTQKSIEKAYKKIGVDVSGRMMIQLADGTVQTFGDFSCYRVGGLLVVSSCDVAFSTAEQYGELNLYREQQVPSSRITASQWWQFGDTIKYLGKLPEKTWTYNATGYNYQQANFPLGARVRMQYVTLGKKYKQPPVQSLGRIVSRRWKYDKVTNYTAHLLLVAWDNFTGGHIGKDDTVNAKIDTPCCTWVDSWQVSTIAVVETVKV